MQTSLAKVLRDCPHIYLSSHLMKEEWSEESIQAITRTGPGCINQKELIQKCLSLLLKILFHPWSQHPLRLKPKLFIMIYKSIKILSHSPIHYSRYSSGITSHWEAFPDIPSLVFQIALGIHLSLHFPQNTKMICLWI